MRRRTVLVLGAGSGGLVAARRLRRRLPATDRVVLVDRATHHLFQPSLLWLLTGDRTPSQITRPLRRVTRLGIELVTGTVAALDVARRTVRVGDQVLEGDALIVALGAQLAAETVPGLAEAGHNLYTLDGATAARDALTRVRGGRVVVLTSAPLYKCPAAPYEAAMLVRATVPRAVEVRMIAAEPGPMGTAGPEVSAAVRAMVEETGVMYQPSRQISTVDSAGRTLQFADGSTESFDILLYVPPHRAPGVLVEAGLTGSSGWIEADPHTLTTAHPGVYAVGDATMLPLPSGKVLPKAGVFAHAQAKVVADNLAAEWTGRESTARFLGTGACFLETGHGRAGLGSGDFYAHPVPRMRLHAPTRWWHWGKVVFEKWWLARV
ncbi:MAG: FAD/NAD(P)-binding oxidoreductase [Gemmatimonadales bacterium]